MPMIIVRYVTPTPRPELRARIAELAARLGSEKLGKDPGVTAMLIEEADPKGWFIGNKNPTDEGLSAFWMDFKITVGTNTKDETAAFVKAAFEGMEALLGRLHEECYVLGPRRRRRRLRLWRPHAERPLGCGPSGLKASHDDADQQAASPRRRGRAHLGDARSARVAPLASNPASVRQPHGRWWIRHDVRTA